MGKNETQGVAELMLVLPLMPNQDGLIKLCKIFFTPQLLVA